MERRAVSVIEPITWVQRQKVQFRPVGEICRLIDDKTSGADTSPDGHA